MTGRTIHLQPAVPDLDPREIDGDVTLVGRGDDVVCSIAHESLSRRHASFRQTTSGWIVADHGSKNGTFVNWIRLEPEESVPLQEGDVVAFGTAEFVVHLEGPPFAEARPAPVPRTRNQATLDATEYRTRGSLLMRLGDDSTMAREISWKAFYDQYVPIIRGFARNAGCPASSIDDVIHEVMANFFRAAERFEYDASKGRFRGYLKTATINTLRKRHQKASREPRAEVDPNLFADGSDVADAMWTRAWRSQMLERAIAFVREETRMTAQSLDAFELCAVRGVPVEEAARQLGLTPDATQKAKSRVSIQVREELERIRQEEG